MKERESNIELLRCIAIFMIIAVHADYWLLGVPTQSDLNTNPSGTFWRVFWECVTVIGTNVFVLISGWFSIRPSLKSFLSFLFQIEFFLLGVFLVGVIFKFAPFSLKSLASCFLFTSSNWFIKSYIGLYICAPILNAFIEKVNKQQLLLTIILFYVFQTIYGWSNAAPFVEQGYSTFSFIGLYLIARYTRIYGGGYPKSPVYLLICSISLNIIFSMASINFDIPVITVLAISYVNPLVILGSLGLLISFQKLNIGNNKLINKIGRSTFAVYLLPSGFIFDYLYRTTMIDVYSRFDNVMCFLLTVGILILTFACAIIIDQFRIKLWGIIWKLMSPFIDKKFKKLSF